MNNSIQNIKLLRHNITNSHNKPASSCNNWQLLKMSLYRHYKVFSYKSKAQSRKPNTMHNVPSKSSHTNNDSHTTHCITKALGNVSISSVVVSCTHPPGPSIAHGVPPLWPVC